MKIYINEIAHDFSEGATLEEILNETKLPLKFALWLNGKPIKKNGASDYILENGDKVRITRIVMGG